LATHLQLLFLLLGSKQNLGGSTAAQRLCTLPTVS
jgi:hypothetical protein